MKPSNIRFMPPSELHWFIKDNVDAIVSFLIYACQVDLKKQSINRTIRWADVELLSDWLMANETDEEALRLVLRDATDRLDLYEYGLGKENPALEKLVCDAIDKPIKDPAKRKLKE